MAQLQYLSLPEINMLVQMLNARVTFLESNWCHASFNQGVTSFANNDQGLVSYSRPPTSGGPSKAVPVVDPNLDKTCSNCKRRFIHLKHRMCNRCARKLRREKEKHKTHTTSGGDASSDDDESTVRPKLLPSKEPGSLSSDATPFTPPKPVHPKGVNRPPPAVKKRVTTTVTNVRRLPPKPKVTTATAIKLKPRPKSGGGGGVSTKVKVQTSRKPVVSASEEFFPDPPSDMVAQPKFAKGFGPCPGRFEVDSDTEDTALWVLRKEWQGYADQEAAWEKANMRFLINSRNSEGVLHIPSGKHVAAYSVPPGMGIREDTIRYLEMHPDVQPWIMRVGPVREKFSLEPLKWSRPSWIGKRKTPAKRKHEQKRSQQKEERGRQASVSPPPPEPEVGVSTLPVAVDPLEGTKKESDALAGVKSVLGVQTTRTTAPSGLPGYGVAPVQPLSSPSLPAASDGARRGPPVVYHGIMPPVMIFDSDEQAVQGQAFKAFLDSLTTAFNTGGQRPEAITAANTFWKLLFQRGIVNEAGTVVKRPDWMSKKALKRVYDILTSKTDD